ADDLPVSASWGTEWLSEQDAANCAEDGERNEEQATRNAGMREMLKLRREEKQKAPEPAAVAPETVADVI
ncbi:unnamed protein product, partial [Polarella glacialis]